MNDLDLGRGKSYSNVTLRACNYGITRANCLFRARNNFTYLLELKHSTNPGKLEEMGTPVKKNI